MTSPAVLASCGHETEVPAQLCAFCANQLRERLDRTPRLYDALVAWLPPAGRRPELGHAPAVEAPLPLRETVLDLRGPGGIVGVLEGWWTSIHEVRDFRVPEFTGTIPGRIARAAQAVQANLTWISLTWEQGPELAGEIRHLEQRALAVINPPDRTIPIGACPTDLGDGVICATTIRVPAGTTDVYCKRCGTRFPPEAWLNLRRWMDQDRRGAEGTLAA